MPLEAGTWFWEVQLLQKGDEVWLGVCNDESCADDRWSTHADGTDPATVWYYDGSRSYRGWPLKCQGKDVKDVLGFEGELEEYGTGNTISFLLDMEQDALVIYRDGIVQAVVRDLPPGPLWPIGELDDTNDHYVLRRACRLASDAST